MVKRVSLKDIAREVGVSSALVSYVLNDKKTGRINKVVAQKIKDTAKLLNYHTNQIARSLKTNKTNTIGLIVADISNPFSATMARIIEDEAAKKNYTVIFGSSDENPFQSEKLIETFMNRYVDGLIIAPRENTEYLLHDLVKQEIPFVLFDRYFPSINTSYVAMDNFKASFDAVKYLIKCGYKKIGIVNYQSTLQHLNDRTNGYLKALETLHILPANNLVKEVAIDNIPVHVENAINELMAMSEPPDAILFASGEIALHGVKHIKQQNIKVPSELALISFDEMAAWDLFYAPLTYIKQPLQKMGQLATKILIESIEDNSRIQRYHLPGSLVTRQSTKLPL